MAGAELEQDLGLLRERAESWLADDPDPASRAELRAVLDALPGSGPELADRFSGPLTFGTAGLRGPLRAGPNGMNLAVVRAAAAGLVGWLAGQGARGPLVIGYDARHGSRQFAEQTARVATGAGRDALLLPRPLPTPVLAYAVRRLSAAAGVMVTASHNPPRDNGYKVYLGAALGGPAGAGAQIVPPADAGIEAAIRAVGPLAGVPLGGPGAVLGEELVEGYVSAAASVVAPGGPRELTVAYTPLHGVGADTLAAAFIRAGFSAPLIAPAQAAPDPDFPTVAFPNPEEPGAMDQVTGLAEARGADLAIANDPDADRCAVAVPTPGGGWRMLRGDEVGALLADHLLRRGTGGLYATTVVSSALLRALCAARGATYAETLTGFKWIVRAGGGTPATGRLQPPAGPATAGGDAGGDSTTAGPVTASGDAGRDGHTAAGANGGAGAGEAELAYGYEEALGYCVAPGLVRDKDGITAALLIAELAAGLRARGRTLLDRLDELAAEFGVYATDQLAARMPALERIGTAMARVRSRPPAELAGAPVTEVTDRLPDADVLILRSASARVVVRPSGTEPKLKAYLEVVEPVGDGDVAAARLRAADSLRRLRGETAAALGLD